MGLEEVFTVSVKILNETVLKNDDGDTVVMISFTGTVSGKYFEGTILDGGIDTQIISQFSDRHSLSARYMLSGKDYTGQNCEIYIENNGNFNKRLKKALFRTYPKMITNSKALSFLNEDILVGEGVATDSGVEIKIKRWTT